MLKKLKKNWKNLAIIVIATLVISVAKSNLKNGTSLAYSLSNEIYQFAGYDKIGNKLSIAQRVKQEADYCKDGYVVSDWTFEKEAQLYRSNTIYGCPSKIYSKNSTKCEKSVNIKTLNNAYNGNYILEESWGKIYIYYHQVKNSRNFTNAILMMARFALKLQNMDFLNFKYFVQYRVFQILLNAKRLLKKLSASLNTLNIMES